MQYLKRKFCVRVVGQELPWSRDARIPCARGLLMSYEL